MKRAERQILVTMVTAALNRDNQVVPRQSPLQCSISNIPFIPFIMINNVILMMTMTKMLMMMLMMTMTRTADTLEAASAH